MQTPPPHGDTDAAERVARAVLDTWATHVGPRGTDLVVRNGAVEWTILAGVCLVLDGDRDRDGDGGRVLPIALGTGTKTLPYEAVRSVPGDALHDSHAEVLARRGARRWIAERIMLEASMGGEPEDQQDAQLDGIPRLFQRDDATRRWRLKSNVKVWWYISTLPCGECSMPLLARRRAREDALLARSGTARHKSGSSLGPSTAEYGTVTRGRNANHDHEANGAVDASAGGPSHLCQGEDPGATPALPSLRTVPGRADSPPSLSHSCTDKLLLWSLVGWQGAALSRWVEPLRIDGIVASDVESAEVLQELDAGDGEPNATGAADAVRQQLQRDIERGLDVRNRWRNPPQDSRQPPESSAPSQVPCQDDTAAGPSWALSQSPPLIRITTQTFPHSQETVRRRAIDAGLLPPVTSATSPTPLQGQLQLVPSWESTSYIRPQTCPPEPVDAAAQGTGSHSKSKSKAKAKAVEYLVHGIKRGASARRVPPGTSGHRSDAASGAPTPARLGVLASGARARSRLCKLEYLALLYRLQQALPAADTVPESAAGLSYADLKGKGSQSSNAPPGTLLYRRRKAFLRGEADVESEGAAQAASAEVRVVEKWLEKLGKGSGTSSVDATEERQTGPAEKEHSPAPLSGWLVTPRIGEGFDVEGNWAV